jgi:hypothetical protein
MPSFLFQAVDSKLGCSVLEAIMNVDDLEILRRLLGPDADNDSDFSNYYVLSPDEVRAITDQFCANFEPISQETYLSKWNRDAETPYLIHTNFELLLMLDGRKPFSMFGISYPTEEGEDEIESLFEPHVQAGQIKKFVRIEQFESPIKGAQNRVYDGIRHLFYTLPGEEWRVEAHRLVKDQLKFGRWNYTLERLEGTLLGYTETENAWWSEHLHKIGRVWGSISLYAAISSSTLEWVRASGCRALPWDMPDCGIELRLLWPPPTTAELDCLMEASDCYAVIRLAVRRKFVEKREARTEDGNRTYQISGDEIPELNRFLEDQIAIIAERAVKMTGIESNGKR